ncbi:MAG: hypothetical protein AAF149_09715 [Bacteroidota bacterium]
MNQPSDFDQFFIDLQQRIQENPTMQYRIILGAIKSTDCPYLKRKLRKMFKDESRALAAKAVDDFSKV